MGRLIEGLWDCKYCDTKEIGGSKRECPNCGKPRDENTKFYMPGTISYVSKEREASINRNSDWLCSYCDCLNSASDTSCKSCGAERNSENLDYFANRNKKDEAERNQNMQVVNNGENNSKTLLSSIADFFSNHGGKILVFILLFAVISGIIYACVPKTEQITVESFSWSRSIDIEEFKTVNESDWYLPSEARLKSSKSEIHSYLQVLDHYEKRSKQVSKQRIVGYEEYVSGYKDLGNGYFEEIKNQRPIYETYYETEYYDEPVYRSEPVYKTKYYYEIDKWVFNKTLMESGIDKEPVWPDTQNLEKNFRTGNKKEEYSIIVLTDKGKEKKVSVSYDIWEKLEKGQRVKMKISISGNGELIKE